MSAIPPNFLDRVPGLQYPNVEERTPEGSAIRNIYDNLFYIRKIIDSQIKNPSVSRGQVTEIIKNLTSSVSTDVDSFGQFIVGTHTIRLTLYDPGTLDVGQAFYETDRRVSYVVSDASGAKRWVLLGGVMEDALSNIPTDLGTDDIGFTFVNTDSGINTEYIWNGLTWWTTGGYLQEVLDAATNVVSTVNILRHLSSGNPAASFGARQVVQLEDAANQTEDASSLTTHWTNATSGAETSRWYVSIRNAGVTLVDYFTVAATHIAFRVGNALGLFVHANSADRTYTFPDANGNIPYETAAIDDNSIVLGGGGALIKTSGFSYNPAVDAIVSPKAVGAGIQVDTASPTYGWHDIIGEITIRVAGADDPTFSIFRDGIRNFEFSATADKEVYIVYHVPHDYIPGTDIYFHAHWGNNNVAPNTGNVRWGFEYTSAKGHQQAAFPASTTVYALQACNATQYWHHIAETSAVTITGLEPDSLILVRVFRDANDAADTCTNSVFLFTADIHYQSTGIPTKQKAPDFYT